MGGKGSGNRNGRPKIRETPDYASIERARLRVGRALVFAGRMGREPVFDKEDIRLVLFGIIAIQAENRNLVHDLRRVMERENALLNEERSFHPAPASGEVLVADHKGGPQS